MAHQLTGKTIASTFEQLWYRGTTEPGGTTNAVQVLASENDQTDDIGTALYIGTARVGIGIAAPLSTLHIRSGDGSAAVPHGDADELVVEGATNTGITIASGGTTNNGYLNFGDQGVGTIGQIAYTHTTDDLNDIMAFKVGATTNVLVLKKGGNVGIGTAAPGAELEVASVGGNSEIEISCWSTNEAQRGRLSFQKSGIATIDNFVATEINEDLGSIAFYGVNNESPNAAEQAAYILCEQDADKHADGVAGRLVFATSTDTGAGTPTPRMTIDDGGNVGIGNTAPSSLLTVGGNVSGESPYIMSSSNTDGNSGFIMAVNETPIWYLRNSSADQIQIYDGGDSSVAMHCDTTEEAWGTGSDSRIKENVVDIGSILTKLNSLRPVTYQRKYSKADKTYAGLVAQEVLPYFPLMVTGTESSFKEIPAIDETQMSYEGGLSLKYASFVPYLIKAIQELSAKVTALENA